MYWNVATLSYVCWRHSSDELHAQCPELSSFIEFEAGNSSVSTGVGKAAAETDTLSCGANDNMDFDIYDLSRAASWCIALILECMCWLECFAALYLV
jgi:hypothetical protein